MLSLAVLALSFAQLSSNRWSFPLTFTGEPFIALPDTPTMYTEAGTPFPSKKLIYHKLTYLGWEEDGTQRFLVDDKTSVHSRDTGLYADGALRRLVDSAELRRLQKTYVGRPLWCYGGRTLFRELDSPRTSGGIQVDFDKPVRIERIFQLERARCRFSGTGQWGGLGPVLPMSYEPKKDGPESPFIVVYRRPAKGYFIAGGDTRWSAKDKARAEDERNFSVPFNAFVGSWFFDRVFSLNPPPAKVKRAIKKFIEKGSTVEEGTPGMTHEEMVWAFGWPMQRLPKETLLKAQKWTDHDYYGITFKGDRVVEFHRSLPH